MRIILRLKFFDPDGKTRIKLRLVDDIILVSYWAV